MFLFEAAHIWARTAGGAGGGTAPLMVFIGRCECTSGALNARAVGAAGGGPFGDGTCHKAGGPWPEHLLCGARACGLPLPSHHFLFFFSPGNFFFCF